MPPSPFTSQNLNQRVLSALALTPIILGFVWWGGLAFNMLVIASMLLGMFEWLHLTVRKPDTTLETAATLGLLIVLGLGAFGKPLWALEAMVLAVLILFYFAQAADKAARGWLSRALWVVAGVPYLGLSGLGLILVRRMQDQGLFALIYLLLAVWATDIGGYFAGRTFGGPKLAPQISPNKTWAGLGGGMALAAAVGYLAAWGFGDSRPWGAALVALPLALVAQIGDLFESHAKRRAGVKDSGALIPGHGGLLDRIDGLLFAAMGWSLYLSLTVGLE